MAAGNWELMEITAYGDISEAILTNSDLFTPTRPTIITVASRHYQCDTFSSSSSNNRLSSATLDGKMVVSTAFADMGMSVYAS